MQNRRDFLRQSVAGSSLALLTAGCSKPSESAPAPTASPSPKREVFSLPPDSVEMSIAKWTADKDLSENIQEAAIKLTEQAVKGLGGLEHFLHKGCSVWVKPNINFHRTPEFAANTNPDVVGTVVRLCYEAGAGKVRMGDHSSFGSDKSYPMSGIEAAAKTAGAEVVYLDESKFKEYSLGGKIVDKWPLSQDIVESDVIIDVPVAKQHPLPRISGCMKNLMGVAGGNRSEWHANIAKCVCDITAFLRPRLCVVDALRVITAGPPKGGNLDDLLVAGAVAAGVDPVALDAWICELLGYDPNEVETLVEGHARGLGQIDYRKLKLAELTV